MCKVLAVSGGVDSMVMLDLVCKKLPKEELVVTTFNHGTRENAKNDAEFVCEKAKTLGLKKVYKGEAGLGEGASEEKARKERYKFLNEVAEREGGEIWTAHHLDDLVESIAINIIRGTGSRGLAVLSRSGVRRPFLDGTFGKIFDRRDILKYAAENEITFRHDQSNTSDVYLRNRVREKTFDMPLEKKLELYELWRKQRTVMHEIDEVVDELIPKDLRFEREWFLRMDDETAMEILRTALLKIDVSATRPQILDFLKAIREYAPGKKFNLPGDKLVRLNRKDFMLK